MTAFNRKTTRPAVFSPITSRAKPGFTTYEGANATARDAKGDLFVLAAGSFFGQDSFYERGNDRADRFRALVAVTTATDSDWTARFLKWLRSEANIRTGAIVGAVEFARTVQKMNEESGSVIQRFDNATPRAVIRSVLQRADEPGEMLAYYTSLYGRSVPISIKRGIADAIVGHGVDKPLYTQFSALKYDTPSHGFRFADVLEITHPTGEHPSIKHTQTAHLFQWLVDRRHGRGDVPPESLEMVIANKSVRMRAEVAPSILLNSDVLNKAGFTWEDALSLAGPSLNKAHLWEALIPNMGYMAKLRNLRNFDEAGVSDSVALHLAAQLATPENVAKSRQLPFRFWSAYKTAPSLRWGHALERALDASVSNVPELPGRTLVLVDTSGSMTNMLSAKSTVSALEAAALFGTVTAARGANVDLIGFATDSFVHNLPRGGSVLKGVESLVRKSNTVGWGTNIVAALRKHYNRHDRVVIFTDMQVMGGNRQWGYYTDGDVSSAVPGNVPLYAWNLMGYAPSMMETGTKNRHELGGFSDSAFSIMQRLEAGTNGRWPF